MSDSRHFCDAQKPKSHFIQTCNLLSRYIKEKGSLKDLNLEIGGKIESFEAIVKPGSSSHPVSSAYKGNSALDSSINGVEEEEEASFKATSKEGTITSETSDSKTAPLTIFYSGRVLVFDDYPAEKAKELLALAKKGSSQMSYAIWSNTLPAKSSPPAAASAAAAQDGLPPWPQACSSANGVAISLNTCSERRNSKVEEKGKGSDLPIARRSSLHRFLEKRKDRNAARGPYQVQGQPSSSSKDEQLELKL